jgi:hypothetical protein
MAGYNPSQSRDYHGRFGSGDNPNGSSSKSSGKLTGADAKVGDRLAQQIAKAAKQNAARDQKQRDQKIAANKRATMAAQRASQASAKRMAGGIHSAHAGTNSSRAMGFSGAGSGGSAGGGARGSGAGSNPSPMAGTANRDGRTSIDADTGVRTTRFNNGDDQAQHVKLSPAAREAVNKFKQMDANLYHNSGSMPHAAHMAKQIAASHGAHSTGIVSLPRSMKQASTASANPGHAGPAPHGNSSEKFTGRASGVPKAKKGTLESGTGTRL